MIKEFLLNKSLQIKVLNWTYNKLQDYYKENNLKTEESLRDMFDTTIGDDNYWNYYFLCDLLPKALMRFQSETNYSHDIVIENYIPLFNWRNAKKFAGAGEIKDTYMGWWPIKDYRSRELFLSWMISKLEEDDI